MRLKIRSPNTNHVLSLADDAVVATLLREIRQITSISNDLEIKVGYPPKPLLLHEYPGTTLLSELPIKLQGEQLMISSSGSGGFVKEQYKDTPVAPTPAITSHPSLKPSESTPFSFTAGPLKTSVMPSLLTLKKSAPMYNKDDPPLVPLESGRGTVLLRVMEDDNSCLFRAISYVMTRSMISVEELRQVIAGTIQSDPVEWNAAVLDQKPDSYCEWIKMESSWGGAIESEIFARYFEMEICTIDVATGNVFRFNEGKERRVIVVYSGIHYDAVALSPTGSLIHEADNDEMVFDKNDKEIIEAAKELCAELKKKNYFTDTKNFDLRCNICKSGLKGQKEAIEHAQATGHQDFGEY